MIVHGPEQAPSAVAKAVAVGKAAAKAVVKGGITVLRVPFRGQAGKTPCSAQPAQNEQVPLTSDVRDRSPRRGVEKDAVTMEDTAREACLV